MTEQNKAEIPQGKAIEKINKEANKYGGYEYDGFIKGAEFGYSLAQQEIAEAKKEIEKLKANWDEYDQILKDGVWQKKEIERLSGLNKKFVAIINKRLINDDTATKE